MGDKTGIEWTDATWNPVTGCSRVSAGCAHCYAETFAERWRGTPGHHFEQGFDLKLWPDRLTIPMKWKRPRKIFVNSMSDLFHEKIPVEFIVRVFAVMAVCPQHTFQVLTKRPARMLKILSDLIFPRLMQAHYIYKKFPLPNVWLGVSVEDQRAADERIPLLLQTPAAVRFLSCEPLLGPLKLHQRAPDPCGPDCWLEKLDWIICGGESGHGARPMKSEWALAIRNQAAVGNVPFFFKQWGGVRKSETGCLLDGKEYKQFPEVRQ